VPGGGGTREGGCAGVGGVGGGDAHGGGVVVGARHIHLRHTLRRHGLAGDGHVDGAALEAGGEAAPLQGHDLQLPAVLVADPLGDHHVIAVGVGAGVVGDGHRAVGVVGLGPVVGGVGALHAHGEDAVLYTLDGGAAVGAVAGPAVLSGVGAGVRVCVAAGGAAGVAAAGGQGQGHRQGQGQGEQSSCHVFVPLFHKI